MPTATPPVTTTTNSPVASKRLKLPETTAATANLKATRAVPSLISDSPSTIETIRPGIPSRRAMAVAATGSVGETIAPSTNEGAQSNPSASWATSATPIIVARTRPIARAEISRTLRRSSRSGVKYAAAYRSGGRITIRTRSGLSSTSGIGVRTASPSPPRTSRIGYGTRVNCAARSSRTTTARIVVNASSMSIGSNFYRQWGCGPARVAQKPIAVRRSTTSPAGRSSAATRASITAGSNWAPAQRSSSAAACCGDRASR